MRVNFGKETFLYPMPVLLIGTYSEEGKPNLMNAAWDGIHDTNQLFLCLSSSHKTTKNIKLKREFTVSLGNKKHIDIVDYVGLESGNDVDKIKKANLTVFKSDHIDAPLFREFEMALELRVKELIDDGITTYVIADIENVNCEDSCLTDSKIDYKKLGLISFDPVNNKYIELGESAGDAFSIGSSLI